MEGRRLRRRFAISYITLACAMPNPANAMKYLSLLLMLSFGWPAQAQIAKIVAEDPEAGASMGSPLVTNGDWLFASAISKDTDVADAGAVYVFRFDGQTWTQQQVLTVASEAEDLFGLTLASEGRYMLVGSWLADRGGFFDSGAAYIYSWDGEAWVQQAELQPPELQTEGSFASAVALHGDYALVGAYHEDVNAINDGAAYLYRRDGDTWSLETALTAPNLDQDYRFGASVALGEDIAFVAADNFQVHKGFVYVYEKQDDGWHLTQTLQSTQAGIRAFGRTLIYHEGRLFVGDALAIQTGGATGAIFVYDDVDGTWQEQFVLYSGNETGQDYFGDHMTLAGPYLFASAKVRLGSGSNGIVYQFEENDGIWTREEALPRPDLEGNRHFYGANLTYNKGFLYVSASGDNEQAEGSGAVYVYRVEGMNPAPTAPELTSLPDGTYLDLTGDPAQPLSVTWTPSVDPDGEAVTYRWQVSLTSDFADPVLSLDAGAATQLETTYGDLATSLTAAGVALGETVTLYHRAVASDGENMAPGFARSLDATRNTLTHTERVDQPSRYTLSEAYPNPFNPQTRFLLSVAQTQEVSVEVFDLLGRRVDVLYAGPMQAQQSRSFVWEAGALPSGLYAIRVVGAYFADTRQVMLAR